MACGQYHSTYNTNHAAGRRSLQADSCLTHILVGAVVDCVDQDQICASMGHKVKGAKRLRTENINY